MYWYFSFVIEHITNIFKFFKKIIIIIILWAPWTLFLFSFTSNFTLCFGLKNEKEETERKSLISFSVGMPKKLKLPRLPVALTS